MFEKVSLNADLVPRRSNVQSVRLIRNVILASKTGKTGKSVFGFKNKFRDVEIAFYLLVNNLQHFGMAISN
jgi:hypothetical protein